MPTLPRVILHPKKVDAVKRFHPWVFSGAIQSIAGDVKEGDIVEVYSSGGEFLATGHYAPGSIAVRIFAFAPVENIADFIAAKLQQAYGVRQQAGLVENPVTNCYRLVNGEGDGLPGLVIDWYNGTAIVQAHSLGMYEQRIAIVEALRQIYGDRLEAVYDKSASTLMKKAQTTAQDSYLWGKKSAGKVLEYQNCFFVDWEDGQKTGFFLDQRENRRLLANYVDGKTVLNTFCYSGGFSVYALQAQAQLVHSVDSSTRAIDLTEQNLMLNPPAPGEHAAFTSDVFEFLKQCDRAYDVIVLDPPAFAKNISARHKAMQAYRRLNQQAIAKLNPGGLLFTFSCSQAVLPDYFTGAVTAGAIDTGRPIRILHHLLQPPDHPVSIYHPEGLYLKGLVLRVE
jgi:23S rRNA (cytosine1962-C5)-methyltransferase